MTEPTPINEPAISLRDYFAARAMQAMIQKGMQPEDGAIKRLLRFIIGEPIPIWWSTPHADRLAERAYSHADALLKARDARP